MEHMLHVTRTERSDSFGNMSLDNCSERWSCSTLEHIVQHDQSSLLWFIMIVSETVRLYDLRKTRRIHSLCAIRYCSKKLSGIVKSIRLLF